MVLLSAPGMTTTQIAKVAFTSEVCRATRTPSKRSDL
jgi:hypothetical protein